MDWSVPGGGILLSLDAAVLTVLTRTSGPLTGREVARLARQGSPAGVQRALDRLVGVGLVDTTKAGRANLYVFNNDHVAAAPLGELLRVRNMVFSRIQGELAGWTVAPIAAAVFGSAARGEGRTTSDLDLLLIRPAGIADDDVIWSEQVDSLSQLVRRWSGNAASIIQLTSAEMEDAIVRGEAVVDDLRADAVTLTKRSVLDVSAEG
jgi:predicted nucleotidyltransferase